MFTAAEETPIYASFRAEEVEIACNIVVSGVQCWDQGGPNSSTDHSVWHT
jgi:hypothetical protein